MVMANATPRGSCRRRRAIRNHVPVALLWVASLSDASASPPPPGGGLFEEREGRGGVTREIGTLILRGWLYKQFRVSAWVCHGNLNCNLIRALTRDTRRGVIVAIRVHKRAQDGKRFVACSSEPSVRQAGRSGKRE
jgi:hypothetical protein